MMKQTLINLVEKRVIPDPLTRFGMRRMIGDRLQNEYANDSRGGRHAFLSHVTGGPIADHTDLANDQHYEVPDAFFQKVLGPRLKYSSALYENAETTLGEAENAMLKLTCERAKLEDGMDVLELGCGWGSLTLYMAEHYPNAKIKAVSNSHSQREYIEAQAKARGFTNVTVLTANVATIALDQSFDRVVSVEMFEHMRNYAALTEKVKNWLRPDGLAFVHIFCHQQFGYVFEVQNANDWMAENFFTGGIMPSFDIFENTSNALDLQEKWWIAGTHYQRTLEDWRNLLDEKTESVRALFMEYYSEDRAAANRRIQRWRMFFMASAELFGYADGTEWGVGHFLLRPTS
ncbi:MAG: SAM-dependent methyltransferase [Alphaproteobacteria bacterium]